MSYYFFGTMDPNPIAPGPKYPWLINLGIRLGLIGQRWSFGLGFKRDYGAIVSWPRMVLHALLGHPADGSVCKVFINSNTDYQAFTCRRCGIWWWLDGGQ